MPNAKQTKLKLRHHSSVPTPQQPTFAPWNDSLFASFTESQGKKVEICDTSKTATDKPPNFSTSMRPKYPNPCHTIDSGSVVLGTCDSLSSSYILAEATHRRSDPSFSQVQYNCDSRFSERSGAIDCTVVINWRFSTLHTSCGFQERILFTFAVIQKVYQEDVAT